VGGAELAEGGVAPVRVVEIGYLLRSVIPIPTGDFQDLPSWRCLVAVTALALHSQVPGLLIIPMTLLRQDMRKRSWTTPAATYRPPPPAARRPRGTATAHPARRSNSLPPGGHCPHASLTTGHLERYGRARRRLATTAHAEIDTTTLPVQDIAALIIKKLGLRQTTSGTDH
jgi:hypothetical protein